MVEKMASSTSYNLCATHVRTMPFLSEPGTHRTAPGLDIAGATALRRDAGATVRVDRIMPGAFHPGAHLGRGTRSQRISFPLHLPAQLRSTRSRCSTGTAAQTW